MAKSDPENAIFMDDTPADVKRKIKKSFCEPQNIEKNPILEYFKHIIMPRINPVSLERKEEHGGNKTYITYQQLEDDFRDGHLHPADLKGMAIRYVVELLVPIQNELNSNKKLKELNSVVKKYKITR